MKKIATITMTMVALMAFCIAVLPAPAVAQEPIKFSCSNQIFNAWGQDFIKAFTQATGIAVEVFTASSNSSIYRLMNGYSDIAGTARALYRRHQDYGYMQIAFCKDPLAVIARVECGVDNLTEDQLQKIFSGDITNWKDVGGADLPIIVIVPSEDTAANKNFRRQVMKRSEIRFDFMAYDSTMVIEAVTHFPCGSISFISRGAVENYTGIRTLKINGHAPTTPEYPYFQTFFYVTRGNPTGQLKTFIDFTFSDTGIQLLRKNGMVPVARH